MKKFYYEVTIDGQSFTTSTLAEALKKARKKLAEKGIGVKKSDRALQFNVAIFSFDNEDLKAATISDTVEQISDKEYKKLKEREVVSRWEPVESLTSEQKKSTMKMLSPQMRMWTQLPEIVNLNNSGIKKVECRILLKLDPKQRIGVFVKNKQIYKIVTEFIQQRNATYYFLMKPTATSGFGNMNIGEILYKVKKDVADEYDCEIENIEISLDESVKTLIQKTVNFQEYLAQRGITQRYVAPNAGLDSIDFSGTQEEAVKSLGIYLDNFEPYDKIKTDLIDIETANRRLAENGIFSQIERRDIASRTVQTIERIRQVEGCISTRTVFRLFPESIKENDTWGTCNSKGDVRLYYEPDILMEQSAKRGKESGFHPTASLFQVFVHEDTHAMLNFVMEIFGQDFIEEQFNPLVRELRKAKNPGDILSIYGSRKSANGSQCHEMVAEARTEIICEGKNARPFCRKVYVILMKFYKKALERAKELKIND